MNEQMVVRQTDESGCDITENQHEENKMKDIHVGKRGSEAAGEEQPDKLRKTVRFEQEARVHHLLPEVQLGPHMCL